MLYTYMNTNTEIYLSETAIRHKYTSHLVLSSLKVFLKPNSCAMPAWDSLVSKASMSQMISSQLIRKAWACTSLDCSSYLSCGAFVKNVSASLGLGVST